MKTKRYTTRTVSNNIFWNDTENRPVKVVIMHSHDNDNAVDPDRYLCKIDGEPFSLDDTQDGAFDSLMTAIDIYHFTPAIQLPSGEYAKLC